MSFIGRTRGFLAGVLMALGLATAANAQPAVSLVPVGPAPTGPGQTFQVALTFEGTNQVSAYSFLVHFNAAKVDLTAANSSNVTGSMGSPAIGPQIPDASIPDTNVFRPVGASSASFASTPGNLALLTFTTQAGFNGFVKLGLSDAELDNLTDYNTLSEIAHTFPPFSPLLGRVYVDDDWAGSTPGQVVGGDKVFGTNAFDTVQGGVDAVSPTGVVQIYAGSYPETVVVAKALVLEGPVAGVGVNQVDLNAGAAVAGSTKITAPVVNVNDTSVVINEGILLAAAGGTVNVAAGSYTQLVAVNKRVAVQGVGMPQIASPTGGTAATKALFAVTAQNAKVDGFAMKVKSEDASFGVYASSNFNGLVVSNNNIEHQGAQPWEQDRIAIRLVGTSPYPTVSVTDNVITASDPVNSVFKRGIHSSQVGGVFEGNTAYAFGQDILAQFNYPPLTIQGNTLTGAGIDLTEPNQTCSILNNTFQPLVPAFPQSLLIKHNYMASGTVLAEGNTFRNHRIGIWSGGSRNVTLKDNIFEGTDGVDFEHIRVDTEYPGTFSVPYANSNSVAILGNQFGPAPTETRGVGVAFRNQKAAETPDPDFTSVVVGGPAAEANTFSDGLAYFVRMSDNAGLEFANDLDLTQNVFAGKLPAAMTLAELFAVEDKVYHKLDAAAAGLATVVADTVYVTNPSRDDVSGVASTDSDVQRGIDAVAVGGTVNVEDGLYQAPRSSAYAMVTVHKRLNLLGPNANTAPWDVRAPEAVLVPAEIANLNDSPRKWNWDAVVEIYAAAAGSVVKGFTISGDNPNLDGLDIAGIDTEIGQGVYSEGSDHVIANNIVEKLTMMGVWASAGSAGPFHTNVVIENNLVRDVHGIDELDYGFGLYVQGTTGRVEGNRVSDCRNAIQIQPYGAVGPEAVCRNNMFSGYRLGVWYNYAQNGNTPWLLTNNQVAASTAPAGMFVAYWQGISVYFQRAGAGGVQVTGNQIDGSVALADPAHAVWGGMVTPVMGLHYGPHTSVATNVLFTNNTVTGTAYGYVQESPAAMALAGNTFSVTRDAIRLQGTWTAAGEGAQGGTADIDATGGNIVNGVDTASASLDEQFRIEDIVRHGLDKDGLGLVRVKAGEVFVTDPATAHYASAEPSTDSDIQRGVTKAVAGDVVNVEDGLYLQSNTQIGKALTLLGQSRAGVVIAPAGEDDNVDSAFGGVYHHGLMIAAHDVKVSNLTVNGQANSALTPGKNNFRMGICTLDASLPGGGSWNNLHVDGVTVTHIWRRGISLFPTSITGTLIENCLVDDVSWAQGIYFCGLGTLRNSTINHAFVGVQFMLWNITPTGQVVCENNTFTDCSVFPGNIGAAYGDHARGILFWNQTSPAVQTAIIRNNTLSGSGGGNAVGIYTVLAGPLSEVSNNTINFTDPRADGMILGWSYAAGGGIARDNTVSVAGNASAMVVHAMGSPTTPFILSGNTLTSTGSSQEYPGDGAGIYVSTNFKFASSDTGDSYLTITGDNTITGFVKGIELVKNNAKVVSANITGNAASIHGNAVGVDIAAATATIADNAIYDNGIGVRVSLLGTATVNNNTMYGNPLQFAFDSGAATGATVNGFAMAGRAASDVEAVINANLLTGKVYVGEGSPFTQVRAESDFVNVRNAIQPSVVAAVAADTVRVMGDAAVASRGTYNEQVSIGKALTLLGERGDLAVAGPGDGAPVIDLQNAVGNAVSINTAADDVSVLGMKVVNVGGTASNANGAGVHVSGSDSDRVTIADCDFQACRNGAIFGWVNSSNKLENWDVSYNTVNVPTTGTNGAIDLTNMVDTTVRNNTVVGGYCNMILAADANAGAGPVGTGTVVSNNTLSGAATGWASITLTCFNVQPLAGVAILGNVVTPPTSGQGVYMIPNTGRTITGVSIGGLAAGEGNTIAGTGFRRGVYARADLGPITNLSVSGNTIAMADPASNAVGIVFDSVGSASVAEANAVSVSGVPADSFTGVRLGGATSGAVQVVRNMISGGGNAGATGAGVRLLDSLGASASISVNENVIDGFTGASGAGVYSGALAAGPVVSILGNNLAGNTLAVTNAGAPTLDASGNWLGGQTLAAAQAAVSSEVDFTPWLDVDTDTDVATVGFQGDFSYLNVASQSPQVGATGRIQEGINLLADGPARTGKDRTAYLWDGLFVESNATAGKALTLKGQSRAGVVIAPAAADSRVLGGFAGTYQNGVIVQSSDVSIADLTIDGRANTSLPAGENHFRCGVVTQNAMTFGGISLSNVSVLNPYYRGVFLYGAGAQNSVDSCAVENVEVNYYGAYGILALGSSSVTNNTLSGGLGRGIGVAYGDGVVSGNTVDQFDTGIYHFNYGYAGSTATFTDNEVSDAAIGMFMVGVTASSAIGGPNPADGNRIDVSGDSISGIGILVQWTDASAVVENNLVTADGGDAGMWLFHNESAANPVIVRNNTLTATASSPGDPGEAAGIFLTDNGDYFGDEDGTCYAVLSGNTIAGFQTGVLVENSGNGPVPGRNVVATVQDNLTVDGTDTGLLVTGPRGRVDFAGASPASFAATLEKYIELANAGATTPATEIDATNVDFGGVTGSSSAVLADLFGVEDKVIHKTDDATLGVVRVKTGNMYVTTPGTGPSDESIQNAALAAVAGDTVHVAAGSFAESVNVGKALAFEGAQLGVDARGARGAESAVVGGFTVAADDVSFDGFEITGTAAAAIGAPAGVTGLDVRNVSVVSATGDGIVAGAAGTPAELVALNNAVKGVAGTALGGVLVGSSIEDNTVGTAADPTAVGIGGAFDTVMVTGNVVDGVTSGVGLKIAGPWADTVVQENKFRDCGTGILVDAGVEPAASLVLTRNHVTGMSADVDYPAGVGLEHAGDGLLVATGNWWGHVFGPKTDLALANEVGRGTGVKVTGAGTVSFDPWYIKRDTTVFVESLQALNDRDGDGVWDADEDDNLDNVVQLPAESNRALRDTDGDGFEDGVERRLGSDPADALSVPPVLVPPADSTADTDGDGYADFYEYAMGTDPNSAASRPALGDLSGNGTFTAGDQTLMNQILVRIKPVTDPTVFLDNGDLNRRGAVTNVDSIIMRRVQAGMVTQLPFLP